MFPEHAAFICRTCLTEFKIGPDDFKGLEETGELSCPECGISTGKSRQISRFFEFYPRFTKSIAAMEENGFKIAMGEVFQHPTYKGYHLSEIVLACEKCTIGTEVCMSFIRNMPDFAEAFRCSLCGKSPGTKKLAVEFFRALKNIHEAPMSDRTFRMPFQWDVFRPLGLDPFHYQIADLSLEKE